MPGAVTCGAGGQKLWPSIIFTNKEKRFIAQIAHEAACALASCSTDTTTRSQLWICGSCERTLSVGTPFPQF